MILNCVSTAHKNPIDILNQWCSTSVPREMLLNIENSIFLKIQQLNNILRTKLFKVNKGTLYHKVNKF